MKEEYYGDSVSEPKNNFQEVQRYLLKILRRWPWLVGSFLVSLLIAYYLTSTAERTYQVSTSVLIKDPETMSNTVTDVLYGNELTKSSNSIENETFLIRRFDLVRSTLEDLDFRVIVHHENSPINVAIDSSSTYQPEVEFLCEISNRQMFNLSTDHEEFSDLIENQTYRFGEIIDLNGFVFTIFLNLSAYEAHIKESIEAGEEPGAISFAVNNLDRMADYYVGALEVEPVNEKATILQLSLESGWPAQDIKFLNQLTENYLVSGIKEKVSTAAQTMSFLDRQLAYISDSLNTIEGIRQDFKQDRSVDLSKEGGQLYDDIQSLEKEKANHLIQMEYLSYLKDYVQNEDNDFEFVTTPSSLGVNDQVLSSLIDQLVTEQIKLKQVKTGTRIENPRVKLSRQKINSLRTNIAETANNLLRGNRIASNELERRINEFETQLSSLPAAERKLINIERQYNLSETLYLFLMEKRTEAGILRASTVPDFQIVNQARIQNGGRPVSPKPMINYATAVILGLFFPILFIYLGDKFNNKIYTPDELLALTQIPLLGMIGQRKPEEGDLVASQPQSSIAEGFRNIRSNLRYMTNYGQGGQTFMVSSFVSGEGKTFCAKNLAYTFAIAGKRTLYINTDLRKNNTYEEFGLNKTTGLTELLIDVIPQEAVIHATQYDHLFVIPSGKIPPNPSELLMREKFRDLILQLKKEFDYIIMDTPPRGLLSDAMELIKYADLEIFVVRQGYTVRPNVSALDRLYHRQKNKHPLGIIFNDVDFSKIEYGIDKNAFAYNYPTEG
jgi:capsular exopolysaccharide synthesis family protein